jgi:hypothetical protein
LSQPFSGKDEKSVAHAAPALLTRMSSFGSHSVTAAASLRAPSTVEMSIGSAMQVPPAADSSAAVASHGPALRAEI